MNDLMQSHRRTWEAIPWILNGSASEAQRRSAQEHLRVCADCRESLAFEQRLRDAMVQPPVNPGDAEQGWRALCARLDSAPVRADSAREMKSVPLPTRWSLGGPVRWLAAAVIIEALALGAIVTASWIRGSEHAPQGAYRTLSRPEPINAAPTIRVVLSPVMTLEQFYVLLNSAHLQVVAGPGEAGVWSLAPAADASAVATAAALRELRGNPQVRFAEPIDTGVHALPP